MLLSYILILIIMLIIVDNLAYFYNYVYLYCTKTIRIENDYDRKQSEITVESREFALAFPSAHPADLGSRAMSFHAMA